MVFANQEAYYDAVAASTAAANSGPFIDFMLEEIRDTLLQHTTEKVPNKVPNKSELEVLQLLKERPTLTRAEVALLTGLSESGVKKIISSLKSNGWLERKGSNKSGHWLVVYKLD